MGLPFVVAVRRSELMTAANRERLKNVLLKNALESVDIEPVQAKAESVTGPCGEFALVSPTTKQPRDLFELEVLEKRGASPTTTTTTLTSLLSSPTAADESGCSSSSPLLRCTKFESTSTDAFVEYLLDKASQASSAQQAHVNLNHVVVNLNFKWLNACQIFKVNLIQKRFSSFIIGLESKIMIICAFGMRAF